VTVTLVALVPTKGHMRLPVTVTIKVIRTIAVMGLPLQLLVDNGHVYLVANIDGHCHLALIDSGCELSLAPSTIVGDRVLRPVSQGVFAANGSAIFVQGETEIEMNL